MDDEKLLKKIEDSAQDIEIPRSLQPEEMKKRLEAEKKRNKVMNFRKYGGWAAAAAVFLSALLIAGPVIKNQGDTARSSSPEQGARAAVQEQADEYVENEGESDEVTILNVNDYEELLAMVKESESAQDYEGEIAFDSGVLSSNDAIVYETAEAADYPQSGKSSAESSAPEMDFNDLTAGSGVSGDESADYSSTNIQEKNVDEADIVKTDGTYIYVLDSRGNIRIVEAGTMKLAGEVSAPGSTGGETAEMYIDGDILQVIWTGYDFITIQDEVQLSSTDESVTRVYHIVSIQRTNVTTYDISDKSSPVKKGTYQQDGAYLTSRRNGDYLYVFTSYKPQAEAAVQEKEYCYYVPRTGEEYIPCESIYLPGKDRRSTYTGRSFLVAGAVKNTEPELPADRIAVVSGAETFYVSQENIYSANFVWDDDRQNTDIVRIGYADGRFMPGSHGRVPGRLNNNFSMDEYEGKLRIVTTSSETKTVYMDGGVSGVEPDSSNGLYILDRNLSVMGKIEKLAEGEHIESARFMGDTGYFVTYRETDPLFSVDLSNPENPKILGELKITGFSEYLHFYGEDKLLGLGWETDPDTGQTKGLKCSMFDLSDPENVKETDKLIISDVAYCDVMDNYKAILADPEKNIFGFAYAVRDKNWQDHYRYGVFSYSSERGFQDMKCIRVLEELAEDYQDYVTLRGLYIGDILYITSDHGIESYDMKDGFVKKASLIW